MAKWTWIGRWRREGDLDWPDPADLVDLTWDVNERSMVATYLEEGRHGPDSWFALCRTAALRSENTVNFAKETFS
jgi:hypothetical protein